MKKINLISLKEMALDFNVPKSLLTYYLKIGLITPAGSFGGMFLFEKDTTKSLVKKILTFKKEGLKLNKIVARLKK